MLIFFDKIHIPSSKVTSKQVQVQHTTAVHSKSATAIVSCAGSGSLGCFSGTDSLHVCFITSSSGVIYGSHTGHSSELFISAEDKRKSWLYYPEGVGLFTQQTGLIGQLQQACITHI